MEFDYAKSASLEDALYEYLEVCRLVRAKASDLILDVGCGLGHLRAVYPNVVGVDLAVNSKADVLADARHLPFRDGVFDVAVSVEVLEHLDRDGGVEMLREMCRVARRVGVSTANSATGMHDERHVYEWSYFELYQTLKGLGVKVLGHGFGGCPIKNRVVRWFLVNFAPWWTWCEWFALGAVVEQPSKEPA